MVASVKQQPQKLYVMDEFQIVVRYDSAEYKQWLDTKQQTQTSIGNVKSCYKISTITKMESQTTAWYDTGTESQMAATHKQINCISNRGEV
jgi:hypothetical protein